MATATFHKKKLYIPREVQEKMGLRDGDQVEIEVHDGEARLRPVKSSDAKQRLLHLLDTPPMRGKIRGKLTRREIYEDLT